jgi:Fe-S cluster assembly iron-binding protein IscA
MLTLTERATEIVSTAGSDPATADAIGIRISRGGDGSRLGVAWTDGPQPGDHTVECDEGRVYLAEQAAEQLRGATIDAHTDESGRIQFGFSSR